MRFFSFSSYLALLASTSVSAYSGRVTYYNPSVGLGSCGYQNQDSELVVAINIVQFNKGMCLNKICMTFNGVSVEASVVDMCPGCPFAGVDVSPGVFNRLANPDSLAKPISVAVTYPETHGTITSIKLLCPRIHENTIAVFHAFRFRFHNIHDVPSLVYNHFSWQHTLS
ncbi:hypothetical protein HDU97_005004 [Phlyctochytrium planicorne]|nr:hypothetical protein HDU97_005004 [Phlyctochytrium planicorne]